MSDAESLQFERAEFDQAPGEAQCTECKRPLTGSYFDVNGQMVCEACRYTIESRQTAGSSIGRFVQALGAGFATAVVGALLYYGIRVLTGYEFGLIAIVVGFGVGTAVRWGSNNRGGWKYQAMAIAITYLAIVATYVPDIVAGLRQAPAAHAESTQSVAASPAADAAAAEPDAIGELPLPMFVAITIVIAVAAPFLAGFENIIGIVIIGIGLYEAWKINRRTELTITGPHVLARSPHATAGV